MYSQFLVEEIKSLYFLMYEKECSDKLESLSLIKLKKKRDNLAILLELKRVGMLGNELITPKDFGV